MVALRGVRWTMLFLLLWLWCWWCVRSGVGVGGSSCVCRCVTEEVQLIEGAVDAMCLFRSVGQSLVFCIGWDGLR